MSSTGENLIQANNIISILSNVRFFVTVIVTAIISVIGHIIFLKYKNKLLRRMFNNSKHRVGFVWVDKSDIQYELDLLNESSLVKIDENAIFASANDVTKFNFSTLILGIKETDSKETKIEKIKNILTKLNGNHDKRIVLIVYTFGDNRALETEHWTLLKEYKLHYLANFPVNLLDWVLVSLITVEKNF